jgi:hypothetical protein
VGATLAWSFLQVGYDAGTFLDCAVNVRGRALLVPVAGMLG